MSGAENEGAWFAPKAFGYGAGLPIRWQGWAMLIGHMAFVMLGAWLFESREAAALVWIIMFALLPLPVYAAKTKGGWRWRWGERD